MSIAKQKEVATKVIERLSIIDPYVILAGGAPRDWYFEKEASDLDFYLHMGGKTQSARMKQLNLALGDMTIKWERKDSFNLDLYKTMKFLQGIYETEIDGIKVQVMNLQDEGDTFKVVDSMSCSICKAWWKPEAGIRVHQDFNLTVKSGVMFLSEGYDWTAPHPSKVATKFDYKPATRAEALGVYFGCI